MNLCIKSIIDGGNMAYVTVDTNNRVNGIRIGDISQELEIMNGLWGGSLTGQEG